MHQEKSAGGVAALAGRRGIDPDDRCGRSDPARCSAGRGRARPAQVARAAFIPELAVLRKPYADEAIAAHNHRPDLERLADQLEMITVPGGKTLYVWVKEFLDDGDKLGGLLADRGQTTASVESAKAAAALRASTIGLLGRLRSAVQDEIAGGARLPKGYESKLFATFDELHKRREEADPRKAPAATEVAAVKTTPDLALGDLTEK